MTSNVGTQLLPDVRDPIVGAAKKQLEIELRRSFRVEFLNRIDRIIYLRFLASEDLAKILDLMLAKAIARARDRGVTFEVTPTAKAWLLAQNDEPELGARPLRRFVQDYGEDALVVRLHQGEIRPGGAVEIGAGHHGLTCTERQSIDPFGSTSATPPATEPGA